MQRIGRNDSGIAVTPAPGKPPIVSSNSPSIPVACTARNGVPAAVACLEGVRTPSLVAKAVMEQTDHHLIVGKGAQDFARGLGFKIEDDLNTEHSRKLWLEWKRRIDPKHYLDPQKRARLRVAKPCNKWWPRDLIDPSAHLRHDQLRWDQCERRDLRRDDHQRPIVENSRARRRFTDSRCGSVCGWPDSALPVRRGAAKPISITRQAFDSFQLVRIDECHVRSNARSSAQRVRRASRRCRCS